MLTIFVKFYIQSAMNASLFPDHLPSPPSRRSWHSRFLWLPQLGFGLGLVLSSQLAFGPQLWAAVAPSSHLSLGAEQFARENRADPKVELNLFWASEQNNRELRLYSFFESGQGGDRSFDLDRAVVRVPTTSTSAGGRPLGSEPIGRTQSPCLRLDRCRLERKFRKILPRCGGFPALFALVRTPPGSFRN